jgi:hypothetical protein
MLLKPLKRVSVPDADTFEMIEPSAGTATAFIGKLKEFPQIDEGHVSGTYFSGLRILICLYENGKPYLSQLVNSFHAADPETWPLKVQESVSVRQTLEDLDVVYLARVVDGFLDALAVNQMETLNTIIRTELWVDTTKN